MYSELRRLVAPVFELPTRPPIRATHNAGPSGPSRRAFSSRLVSPSHFDSSYAVRCSSRPNGSSGSEPWAPPAAWIELA
jgi:hypothetical protein